VKDIINKSSEISRLVLGTAQIGLDYGIANEDGRTSKDESFRILDYCRQIGLNALDTASVYGGSEGIIGEYIKDNYTNFKIITKLPPVQKFDRNWIEKAFHDSLTRLETESVYGCLIHRFDDFLKFERLWDMLLKFKEDKLVEKIGFSLYRPEELSLIFSKQIDLDILQVPYSVFDTRFSCFLEELNKKNVEVNARSIFLQGLMFLTYDKLTGNLVKAEPYIKTLQNLAEENQIPLNAICLNFALLNPQINKVIIGVDCLEHLKENLDCLRFVEQVNHIYDKLGDLSIEEEDILLPYKWGAS
jgi:aryl-alcohol dehydrogenase-like predicted oxidoreductase